MLEVTSIDLSGLELVMGGVRDALYGVGQDSDAEQVTRQTGMLLAKEIGDRLPPRSAGGMDKKIKRDVNAQISFQPTWFNLKGDQSESSTAGFSWIQAGPNFLLGINDEDNMKGEGGVLYTFRKAQKLGARGKKYVSLGQRGRQRVQRLNRILVTRGKYNLVVQAAKAGVGKLKAALMETFEKLGGNGTPQWISRHFKNNIQHHIFDDSQLHHSVNCSVTFGFKGSGVERYQEIVSGVVERRRRMMVKRIEHILSGYANDHNSGKHIRRHASDES